jgi:glutaredoxin-dependent peroxiredoxin
MDNHVVGLLQKRHATRSISTEELEDGVIDQLAEAARLTPSCFNKQPWRFLFLTGKQARQKGSEVLSDGNRPWASRAPLLIVAYSREENDCVLPGRSYHQYDLGMAVMNLMLAATEHGLVARPMAGFDPDNARQVFGLEEADQPLVMLAVGRPSDDEDHLPDHYKGIAKKPRERKPTDEIVRTL